MPGQPRSGQGTPGRSKKSYPTPDKRDVLLSDALNGNLANYVDLVAGTQHTDFDNFPDHRLLREIPVDWETVARVYAKDRRAEQTYNGGISYLNDSKEHPVFTRDFLIRRSDYHADDVQMLMPLSGLVRANVTAAGAGYTQATVGVTLSGGVGTGGAVTAIVSAAGTIIGFQITEIGHYTISPKMTISDSGVGTGATGEVFLQPKTALLTREQIIRIQDDPLDSLYVLVRRTYMTLPGPWIPDRDYDPLRGPVQVEKRLVENNDQDSTLTATVETTYKAFEESAFVSWEIVRTYSDGTGSSGNPAYPILIDDFYDEVRGAVHRVTQLVADVASAGTFAATSVLATLTSYDAYNQFLRRKIVETWVLPGPTIVVTRMDPESGIQIGEGRTLMLYADITPSNALSGASDAVRILTVTDRERTGIAALLGIRVVTTYPPAAAYEASNAIAEERDGPHRYVGRINMNNASAGLNIGDLDVAGAGIEASISKHDPNPSAEITTITRRTWFVNALAKPTVGILEMQPRSIRFTDGVSNGNFSGVLFDQFRLNFNGVARTITATSPTFSAYFALIGTPIVIDGKAEEIRRYRWRVTTDSVVAR